MVEIKKRNLSMKNGVGATLAVALFNGNQTWP